MMGCVFPVFPIGHVRLNRNRLVGGESRLDSGGSYSVSYNRPKPDSALRPWDVPAAGRGDQTTRTGIPHHFFKTDLTLH